MKPSLEQLTGNSQIPPPRDLRSITSKPRKYQPRKRRSSNSYSHTEWTTIIVLIAPNSALHRGMACTPAVWSTRYRIIWNDSLIRTTREQLMAWIKAPINGRLEEIPGVGSAAIVHLSEISEEARWDGQLIFHLIKLWCFLGALFSR